jgi:hypothetical protein
LLFYFKYYINIFHQQRIIAWDPRGKISIKNILILRFITNSLYKINNNIIQYPMSDTLLVSSASQSQQYKYLSLNSNVILAHQILITLLNSNIYVSSYKIMNYGLNVTTVANPVLVIPLNKRFSFDSSYNIITDGSASLRYYN